MIRREGKGPPSSRDLLVCFPTRAHLTLMPKPVSSPRRHLHHHHHQNHLRKSMRGGTGHSSPYLKQMSSENLSEPTSPKVTCAGQIKVRPRACKNWQTVMEEIERIHISRKKKPNWVEGLGFKKEVMQFLACLRRMKFDFRCLGSFSHVDVISDDEDEGNNNDKEIDQDKVEVQDCYDDRDEDEEVSSRTVFSKWFMVLQENNDQDCGVFSKDEKSLKLEESEGLPCLPPANALLLMRCRSAPAKSWMEEKQEEEEEEEKHDGNGDGDDDDGKVVVEEEHADDDEKMEKKEKKRKSLMELMKNDQSDFYKLSSEVVKETWVIGGIHKDPFSRSRSWKR